MRDIMIFARGRGGEPSTVRGQPRRSGIRPPPNPSRRNGTEKTRGKKPDSQKKRRHAEKGHGGVWIPVMQKTA
jgi:hypothetical protein